MDIKPARRVNASHGWQWINQGVRYFLVAKSTWMMSMFFIGMLSFILIKISSIFQLALVFVLPFIVVGLSMACVDIEAGKKMSINYLLRGFTSPNRFNILRYGVLILLLMFITQIISSIILNMLGINNEQLLQAMETLKSNEQPILLAISASPVLTKSVIISILTVLPVLVINLLSPIILGFSNHRAITAIKLSFMAGVKNLAAFMVYGLIYLGLILIVIFALQFIMTILLSIFGKNSSIALILYMLAFISCITALASLSYCSAYVAFKDIFLGGNS